MEIQGGNRISQIKHACDRIFERILSERNVDAFNGAQGRLLYVLWQEENLSLRQLAQKTGLAATTLTSMVDRMEAAGLVRRLADRNDRRKTRLSLTEKARALRTDYEAVSARMTDIFYAGFTEEEIAQCETMLERILCNLKRHENPQYAFERTETSMARKEEIMQKARELISAPSCCAEAKAAAQSWLDAVGTDKEAEEAKKLIAELKADIMPVDGLLAFAESETGAKVFGEEMAKNVAAHARELKASGAPYCDCAACAASAAILEAESDLL